jgi:hypothetical protein
MQSSFVSKENLLNELFSGEKYKLERILLGGNKFISNKEFYQYIENNIVNYKNNTSILTILFESILVYNPFIFIKFENFEKSKTFNILKDYQAQLILYNHIKERYIFHEKLININIQGEPTKYIWPKKKEFVNSLNNIFTCLLELISIEEISQDTEKNKNDNDTYRLYIEFFNKLSSWLTETLMMTIYFTTMTRSASKITDKQFIKPFVYLIKCFNQSIENKDLSTATVISGVLNKVEVAETRMYVVWDIVKKMYKNEYEKYKKNETIVSTSKQYEKMREYIDKNKSNEKLLPYLGFISTEHYFHNLRIPIKDNMINYKLLEKMATTNSIFRTSQVNKLSNIKQLNQIDIDLYTYIMKSSELCISDKFYFTSTIVSPLKESWTD